MMYSIRRSCQLALGNKNGVFRNASGPVRAFSRSCARERGALPVFLAPSSPELSALLSDLNSKVLLPKHLTRDQQKLVYSQESRAKLEAEPVEITLGDVTLPLQHLNRNHLPNQSHTFRSIVDKSETKDDWENVVRMLEGFENAHIRLKNDLREKAVRKLNSAGYQNLVLKALQRPQATGLRLRNFSLLVQVLRGLHDKAVMADWDQDETQKALKIARQVVELMDDQDHCGGAKSGDLLSNGDWRGKPVVIALPTELAAVLAARYNGDKEEVKKLTSRLVNALKQDDYMTHLSTFSEAVSSRTDYEISDRLEIIQLTIVWNALKTSRNVLGADMPMAEEAQTFEKRVEEVLMQGLETLGNTKADVGSNHLVEYLRGGVEKCRAV